MHTSQQSQGASAQGWRNFWGVTGALFAPVMLSFAWLWAAGKDQYQNDFGALLTFIAPLAVGFACTFVFPMRWYWRIGLFLLYVPVQFWIVFLFGVSYVCGAYGNCL